ncbi:MAG: hypothetical protein IPH78_15340 [Bacteroidetes bacterium]|nr:hypothetical protein [Bacteroidota bacterium]
MHAINTVVNPRHTVNPRHKRKAGAQLTSYHDLRCIITWCNGEGIRSYPVFAGQVSMAS